MIKFQRISEISSMHFWYLIRLHRGYFLLEFWKQRLVNEDSQCSKQLLLIQTSCYHREIFLMHYWHFSNSFPRILNLWIFWLLNISGQYKLPFVLAMFQSFLLRLRRIKKWWTISFHMILGFPKAPWTVPVKSNRRKNFIPVKISFRITMVQSEFGKGNIF